jgi:hypothetical protein
MAKILDVFSKKRRAIKANCNNEKVKHNQKYFNNLDYDEWKISQLNKRMLQYDADINLLKQHNFTECENLLHNKIKGRDVLMTELKNKIIEQQQNKQEEDDYRWGGSITKKRETLLRRNTFKKNTFKKRHFLKKHTFRKSVGKKRKSVVKKNSKKKKSVVKKKSKNRKGQV